MLLSCVHSSTVGLAAGVVDLACACLLFVLYSFFGSVAFNCFFYQAGRQVSRNLDWGSYTVRDCVFFL